MVTTFGQHSFEQRRTDVTHNATQRFLKQKGKPNGSRQMFDLIQT